MTYNVDKSLFKEFHKIKGNQNQNNFLSGFIRIHSIKKETVVGITKKNSNTIDGGL